MRKRKRRKKRDHSLTAEMIRLITALIGLPTAILKILANEQPAGRAEGGNPPPVRRLYHISA